MFFLASLAVLFSRFGSGHAALGRRTPSGHNGVAADHASYAVAADSRQIPGELDLSLHRAGPHFSFGNNRSVSRPSRLLSYRLLVYRQLPFVRRTSFDSARY